MATVIDNGVKKLGAYRLPNRKQTCLCVEEGNTINVYGTFRSEKDATEFMNHLFSMIITTEGSGE